MKSLKYLWIIIISILLLNACGKDNRFSQRESADAPVQTLPPSPNAEILAPTPPSSPIPKLPNQTPTFPETIKPPIPSSTPQLLTPKESPDAISPRDISSPPDIFSSPDISSPSDISSSPDISSPSGISSPLDISEVPFLMNHFESYLVFDKDGLAIPKLKALYQDNAAAYEKYRRNVPEEELFLVPEFYLAVAEYDLNNDGTLDYIIKYPDLKRSYSKYEQEGFIDVVYNTNGELQRAYMDIYKRDISRPVIMLSTVTNGLHDMVIKEWFNIQGRIYQFDGISYMEQAFTGQDKIWLDISTDHDHATIESNSIKLNYYVDIYWGDFAKSTDKFISDPQTDYQFYVAGLFVSAEKSGILKERKLWACDENGRPKLFSTTEPYQRMTFQGTYGGADLSDFISWHDTNASDPRISMDEVQIVIIPST